MVKENDMTILASSTLSGEEVVNRQGENLGDIKDLMIDVDSGRVTYDLAPVFRTP